MKAYLVGHHQIDEVWHKVEPLIAVACEYNNGRFIAANYYTLLKEEKQQLWVALGPDLKGLAITSIQTFPQKKCCVIEMFTGSGLDELLENFPLIEAWAKERGCKQMFAHARVGLSRKLRSQNYRRTHEVLEKDI